jgi:DNA-binding NarL/FixJ family response regulator
VVGATLLIGIISLSRQHRYRPGNLPFSARRAASALAVQHAILAQLTAEPVEGRSNGAIARELAVSGAAVGKHVGNILYKLRLPQTEDTNRRVLAVLAYLRSNDEDR